MQVPPFPESLTCPACAGRGEVETQGFVQRLVERSTETEGGCWEFPTGRYPNILVGLIRMQVHRAAYLIWKGAIHQQVLHHCDNVRCWRPDHLYDGNSLANNRDRRARATVYGRAGADNHFARLTEDQVLAIRAAANEKGQLTRAKAREFASEYGVHMNTVYRAFVGRTWRKDTRETPEPRKHWAHRDKESL